MDSVWLRRAAGAALLSLKASLILLISVSAVVASDLPGSVRSSAVLRLTGIPDENPTELHRRNEPLVAYLEQTLGIDVQYVPVTDYGAAVHALASGKVDFAWLGGFSHVQSRTYADVVPLVMRGIDREFKSVFIAHVDSGVETMSDLRGKTFAFGAKGSTSGHLMPRYFLETLHAIRASRDFEGLPVYSGAHDATVKMVESGKVAAGVVNVQVWQRMRETGKVAPNRVRVVWTTPPYVDYVWTARRAIDVRLRTGFINAFLELDPSIPEHARVLALQGAKRYLRATPEDFDAIEKIALETGLLEAPSNREARRRAD